MLCRMVLAVVAYWLLAVDDLLLDEDLVAAGGVLSELDVASAHFFAVVEGGKGKGREARRRSAEVGGNHWRGGGGS